MGPSHQAQGTIVAGRSGRIGSVVFMPPSWEGGVTARLSRAPLGGGARSESRRRHHQFDDLRHGRIGKGGAAAEHRQVCRGEAGDLGCYDG